MWLLSILSCATVDKLGTDFLKPPFDGPPVRTPSVTDLFVVAAREPELDVLVAIEPDPDLWERFAEVLPGLLASFDDVDPRWRVAFTSTALGGEPGWLAPTGADGGRWLSREDLEDPSVDWSGAPTEAPLGATGATFQAIDVDTYGFRRPEAALQLIVVAQEPDATPESIVTFEGWTEWVGAEDVVLFAAVPPDDPLLSVVATTGGAAVDIDAELDPWSRQVTIASVTPLRPFHLSAIPVQDTVEVMVQTPDDVMFYFQEAEGDPPVGDWSYVEQANAVRFLEYVPEAESTVIARYAPLGEFVP